MKAASLWDDEVFFTCVENRFKITYSTHQLKIRPPFYTVLYSFQRKNQYLVYRVSADSDLLCWQ